jgi:hypothetical protein
MVYTRSQTRARAGSAPGPLPVPSTATQAPPPVVVVPPVPPYIPTPLPPIPPFRGIPAPPATPVPPANPFSEQAMRILGESIGAALSRQRPSAAPDPAKYPKAKDPSMFNGRRRRYLRTWIGENEICFRTAPNLYRTETSKVMFAGSFLEGDAKTWFTDYFKDPNNIPLFMEDWPLFVAELHRNFGLEDEVGAAEEDLRKLSMVDKDHATYFTARFRAVTSNLAGLWDDRNLRNMYYSKIAPRLRAQFVSSGTPVPPNLEPLIAVVERFDSAYWADVELNRSLGLLSTSGSSEPPRQRKPTTQAPSSSTPKPPPPQMATPVQKIEASPHLSKEGKLTDAERKRRMDTGACLYCGAMGHLAKECPKKNPVTARAAVPNTVNSTPVEDPSPSLSPPPAPALQTARASYTTDPVSDESEND